MTVSFLSIFPSLAHLTKALLFTIALPCLAQNKATQAFDLDLGQSFSKLERITVTPAYSNAVLEAILPTISATAKRLNLPVSLPAVAENVIHCSVMPNRKCEAEIGLSGGWYFAFQNGYITTIQGPHSYYSLQDPNQIPRFYGTVKMTKSEAVELGRETIRKLGIQLEDVFAEQEPRITEPERIGTNTVPHYRIEWLSPRAAVACVDIDINAEKKCVERFRVINNSLIKPPPKLSVVPPTDPKARQARLTNPDYAWKLIPMALKAVDEYAQKLSLPIPHPLTTNHLTRFSLADNGGWPHSEIDLTNGWRFIFRNNLVNGYYAADNFFNSDNRPIRIKEFVGQKRLTESEAVELVRRAIRKLDYPTNSVHVDFEPKFRYPALTNLPRIFISWQVETENDLQSKVEAEVDLDAKQLKSLYHDDRSYWNNPPPIDVPIRLPSTNTTSETKSVNQPKPLKPSRPFVPYDSMPKR